MPNLTQHPRYTHIKEELNAICPNHIEHWHKSVFRCVEPKWSRPEYLITGEGTKRNGGRWMRRKITPAVYASSTETIALKEANHNFTRYGFKPRNKPRVLVEIELELSSIVSLNSILTDLKWPSLEELLEEDWENVNNNGVESLSQAFGRVLWELKIEGLRVPSVRDRRGSNLLWFPENLKPDSKISISGESELKRWISKQHALVHVLMIYIFKNLAILLSWQRKQNQREKVAKRRKRQGNGPLVPRLPLRYLAILK